MAMHENIAKVYAINQLDLSYILLSSLNKPMILDEIVSGAQWQRTALRFFLSNE
jgi:hypothetical protein